MSSDFRELLERAKDYRFDPLKLDAIPVTGKLRKSPDTKTCVLVLSSDAGGDLVIEIALEDVVKHEVKKEQAPTENIVTLHVRPTAIVNASLRGRLASALVPAFVAAAAFGSAVREPVPTVAWREIVRPFSRLDIMLNLLEGLEWTECRARGKAACEQFPPGPARDQCVTAAYIACGPRPTLRVDERILEQLVDLFRGPVRP